MFYKIIVSGLVQGVGFRPFVYREAIKRNLVGYVRNIGSSVEIVIDDNTFTSVFEDKTILPPLATIDGISIEPINIDSSFFAEFSIITSKDGDGNIQILPDVAICDDCVLELKDSENRRHNYHFITCTNCGPRFSIITDIPYDRNKTAMHTFNMCDKCKKEYLDPNNRRYHAQTIACPNCGPKLYFRSENKIIAKDVNAISQTISMLNLGETVAIKGIGGYHLVCDGSNPMAVKKLKKIIRRTSKPLAVMVSNISLAEEIAILSLTEKKALLSKARPIVVALKKDKDSYLGISSLDSIGLMLPYTAIHYLILDKFNKPLVVTSCNTQGEPINTNKQNVVTYELSNDRLIINAVDDSVIKFIDDNKTTLRQSRGIAPTSISIKAKTNVEIMAFGGQENNTISIYRNGKVFMSQYMGDLGDVKSSLRFKQNVLFFMKLTKIKPTIIVCDMHPDYYSTKFAKKLAIKLDIPIVFVQHHVAHSYSVALEYGFSDFLGISCDGSGFGDGGGIWGGEVFLFEKNKPYSRVGHLQEQNIIGGASGVYEPKKMLFGILSQFLSDAELYDYFGDNWKIWKKQLATGFNVQKTTSCGRILDAASFLLEFCNVRTYSGEPAIVLESSVLNATPYELDVVIDSVDGAFVLNTTVLFEFLWNNLNLDNHRLAATVHSYLSRGLYRIAKEISGDLPIVFSGGVAYNRYITSYMLSKGVIINSKVPCGDGGLSFGQIGYVLNMNSN